MLSRTGEQGDCSRNHHPSSLYCQAKALSLPPVTIATMDKGTILTQSRVDPDIPLTLVQSLLVPTFANAIYIHRILSSISHSLLLHAYFAASISLWASGFCAFHAWSATWLSVSFSGKMVAVAWDCQTMRAWKKETFEGFAKWILGPGNPIIAMIFWPGWWFLGGAFLAISCCG